MGTETAIIWNLIGVTTMVYAFILNIKVNPVISVLLGLVSISYGIYVVLKAREDWLYRRSERMEHEDKNKQRKKSA